MWKLTISIINLPKFPLVSPTLCQSNTQECLNHTTFAMSIHFITCIILSSALGGRSRFQYVKSLNLWLMLSRLSSSLSFRDVPTGNSLRTKPTKSSYNSRNIYVIHCCQFSACRSLALLVWQQEVDAAFTNITFAITDTFLYTLKLTCSKRGQISQCNMVKWVPIIPACEPTVRLFTGQGIWKRCNMQDTVSSISWLLETTINGKSYKSYLPQRSSTLLTEWNFH